MSHRGDDNGSMHNLLDEKSIDLDSYRKLIKSYIELVSPILESVNRRGIERKICFFLAHAQRCLVLGRQSSVTEQWGSEGRVRFSSMHVSHEAVSPRCASHEEIWTGKGNLHGHWDTTIPEIKTW